MNQDNWEQCIKDAVPINCEWMAKKFIYNLRYHKALYPAFKPERVAAMFIAANDKTRAWYCYRPIKEFTRSIHKQNSLHSQALGMD